jgi:hypothetical protein
MEKHWRIRKIELRDESTNEVSEWRKIRIRGTFREVAKVVSET